MGMNYEELCRELGHETEILVDELNDPVRIVCTRCDMYWKVIPCR